ncbi:N-acetylneuraminate synthase [Paenibacillus thermotolerans]|uniref:N-acetylneuraminate synthase n=1 Tax=Paenibacillus thermotolerans TaxID=3027807 RepID=UPI0023676901|nr:MULTISPECIES: N-acetylneuraminate synthase [unclassified Paenibacillus]
MDNKVYIIAEAGVNHNGSLEMAMQLVDAAVASGADAVKFQTFKAEKLVSSDAPKAEYQLGTTEQTETQLQMLKRLELDENAHAVLIDYCCRKNIQFISTPFDLESAELLTNKYRLPVIKIPSGEVTNAPLLYKVASTGTPIILSTGMCTLADIENALAVIAFGYVGDGGGAISQASFEEAYFSAAGQEALRSKVTLLHCTTEYPAPFGDVNLRAMDTMRDAFGLTVGFSDHTAGISVPIAAVARGAVVIEKHFTLSRDLPGPDHKASLEPQELSQMVSSIREVELALGTAYKLPAPVELKNKRVARKSIVASRDIQEGERFSEQNLTVKRPGDGISPIHYWNVLGKQAKRSFLKDERIEL